MYIKKFILATTILFLIFSCVQKKSSNFNLSDTAVDSILKLETRCVEKKERVISYNDTINFSDQIDKIIFERDTLVYKTDNKWFKRIILLDNDLLTRHILQHQEFNIGSMDIVVDLNVLNICYVKNNPDIIIIKTKPMNWVGTMTRFSLIQLINSKEKTVVEFIRKD